MSENDAPNDWNAGMIKDFRANRGQITAGPMAGAQLLLLTHRGAKSGAERTVPLAYVRDGSRYVIVASKGGAPIHPDWYWNLIANPEVTVEAGTERFGAKATEVKGEERRRLFDLQAAKMPGFAEYERTTTRVIPVFALEPVAA